MKQYTTTHPQNQRIKVLVVIPGLGRSDRLQTVVKNIQILFEPPPLTSTTMHHPTESNLDLTCVIYIYTSRKDTFFWSNHKQLEYLSKYCQLIENIEKKVTENIYMIQPVYLRKESFQYIFLLLDDCLIQSSSSSSSSSASASASSPSFQLQGMIKIMRCNNLSVLSPLIIGANKGGGQKFRNIMQTEAPLHTAGYISSFVEIFAWVMTIPAYTALWNLLCPEVNPYAWGYDFWYDGYARSLLKDHHRMGITSLYRLNHIQDVSPNGLGRTDQTNSNEKWNAVVAQERHYQKHHQIPLAYYRKNLDIHNISWNGAVKGILVQTCDLMN